MRSPLGPGLSLAFAKPDELTQRAEPAPWSEGQPAVGMGAAGEAGTRASLDTEGSSCLALGVVSFSSARPSAPCPAQVSRGHSQSWASARAGKAAGRGPVGAGLWRWGCGGAGPLAGKSHHPPRPSPYTLGASFSPHCGSRCSSPHSSVTSGHKTEPGVEALSGTEGADQ